MWLTNKQRNATDVTIVTQLSGGHGWSAYHASCCLLCPTAWRAAAASLLLRLTLPAVRLTCLAPQWTACTCWRASAALGAPSSQLRCTCRWCRARLSEVSSVCPRCNCATSTSAAWHASARRRVAGLLPLVCCPDCTILNIIIPNHRAGGTAWPRPVGAAGHHCRVPRAHGEARQVRLLLAAAGCRARHLLGDQPEQLPPAQLLRRGAEGSRRRSLACCSRLLCRPSKPPPAFLTTGESWTWCM